MLLILRTHNKQGLRRNIIALLSLVILGITTIVVLYFVSAPYFIKHVLFADTKLDFQYLEPTKLPSDITITKKRIVVSPYDVRAELNLRAENWVYSILETRYNPSNERQNISIENGNYDPKSTEPTCVQKQSAAGKSYRLCHWVDYGKISVYEVKFIQDSTYIDVRLPTDTKTLTTISIDEFVDSFKPASPASLNVIKLSPP